MRYRSNTHRKTLELPPILSRLILVATICSSTWCCGGDRFWGTVTGPQSTDSSAASDEKDCHDECQKHDDAAVVKDTADVEDHGPGDAVAAEDIAIPPLAMGACQPFAAGSLAAVLPCQATNTCCSTAVQYDPCTAGAKVTTAPSRWQIFRFWTAESAACGGGKPVYFHPYPREPWKGEESIETMTWAPTCPGASKAMDWATVRFAQDGVEPSKGAVTLMSSPFAANYHPCGVARVGQKKVAVLGCNQHGGGGTTAPAYWSSVGAGECCSPENALVMMESDATLSIALPPVGFNRWGLPSAIPSESNDVGQSFDLVALVIEGKNLNLQWGEFPSDGYVSAMQAARLSTQGSQLSTVAILGTLKADYLIQKREVAVIDSGHMAWTFDAWAPNGPKGPFGGVEYLPSLAMIVDGGTKIAWLGEATLGVDHSRSHVRATDNGYVLLAEDRLVRITKAGTVVSVADLGPLTPEKGEYGNYYDAIVAPDGGIFYASRGQSNQFGPVDFLIQIMRLAPNGKVVWSWKMDNTLAWARPTQFLLHNGILHVFGILVPKTNDSTWAWHLRLDAATGKELCPGQMPGKP